VYHYGT